MTEEPIHPPAQPSSAIFRAARWLRESWVFVLLCSLVILLPCFWHRPIQAGDLGSHLYTAWLTQSVEQGLLPGLHLDRQYTNILFDLLLSHLLPYFGLIPTARIAVGLCVLVFFWGGFAFASAAANKAAGSVVPLLAMISYGVIFHWGFFNCYLSVGISFFALAIVAGGSLREFLILPLLFVLAAVAHPMGAACMVALGIYLAALRFLPTKYQLAATLLVIASPFIIRAGLAHRVQILSQESHRYWLLGADQFEVFTRSYLWCGIAVWILCGLCILLALRRGTIPRTSPWLQFYLAIALAIAFAPGGFYNDATFGIMGFLPDRASLYSAIAMAALVTVCRPPRWFLVATGIVAIVFFAMLFRDTAQLERRYEKVVELVRPYAGRRVISLLPPVPGSRIHEDHAVDLACVGRCYSYNNYEPSSKQFRLKAEPGNRFVDVDQDSLDDMPDGNYVVQPSDLPLYEVYQCGPGIADFCIAELHAGQANGNVPGIVAHP